MLPPLSTLTLGCASLAVVLGLIWLSQRLVRLSGFARLRAGGRLAVIEALALDPRRKLQLIRCDDRAVLLLTGGTQDLVVGWLPREETRSGPGA
jgi:flagellar protein FliO/FliZ